MGLYNEKFLEIGEYGDVVEVTHPIVTVSGLPNVKSNEIVVFDNDEIGQVQSIRKDLTNILIFSTKPAKVGQKVTRLDDIFKLKLTQALLGKVIDPTGQILDTLTEKDKSTESKIFKDVALQVDKLAPSMDLRLSTKTQFITGVSLIDLLIPIGLGQRELIIGDRKTGKSTLLLTILKNHVQNDGIVVYVTIGANVSETKSIQNFIQTHKLGEKVVLVSSTSVSPHAHVLLSAFTGMTVAEYYKEQGRNVVIILDSLSTHAMYYREISILSRRFPGRDSYPGDIFYLHARLLERAGSFKSDTDSKGSITCFPVAQTIQNDLSDYIVSNLISITDGHILLDTNELSKGRRPAINVALSVTRLGRQTQSILFQDINRQLSSFLTSKYEKSVQLSHFGSELTDQVQRDLEVGNDLYGFFSQDIGVVVPIPVTLVFISMVWLDMFRGEFLTKIVVYRDILINSYKNDEKTRQLIDRLINAKDFKQILVNVISEKDQLLKICKAKKG